MLPPGDSPPDAPALATEIVVESLGADARNDLGSLMLHELPLLVSGRVVDPDGDPIERATVTVKGGNELPPFLTKRDGRFFFYAEGPAQELNLEAKDFGWSFGVATRSFLAGEAGVELRLPIGTGMIGRLVLEPDVPGGRLSLRVREQTRIRPRFLGEGRFRFLGVDPGLTHLEVRLDVVDEPFRVLGPFEITADVLLDVGAIDLRDVVRGFDLRVVDEAGDPIRYAEINQYPPKSRGFMRRGDLGQTGPFGRMRLASATPQVDIFIRAAGYVNRRVTLDAVDSLVTLRPAAKVRFVPTEDLADPDPPYWIEIDIDPVEHGVPSDFQRSGETRRNGRPILDYLIGTPGRYRVRWGVLRPSELFGAGSAEVIGYGEAMEIEIPEGDRLQIIEIPITNEEIERIIQEKL